MTLYEKLNELEEKKQSLVDEMEKENRGTPAEERERLLKQVHYRSKVSHYYPLARLKSLRALRDSRSAQSPKNCKHRSLKFSRDFDYLL